MLNGYLLAPAFGPNMLSRMMLHIADGVTHDSEFISTTNDLLWALMLLAHRKKTARSAWIKLAIIEVPPAESLPPLHILRPQDYFERCRSEGLCSCVPSYHRVRKNADAASEVLVYGLIPAAYIVQTLDFTVSYVRTLASAI